MGRATVRDRGDAARRVGLGAAEVAATGHPLAPDVTQGQVPHCHVPAAFDPDRHLALARQLRRLVGAAQWLEREVREERECHATLAQAAVLQMELHDVVAQLVEGHLRHCVLGAIERGQSSEEIAPLLSPIGSVLFTRQR